MPLIGSADVSLDVTPKVAQPIGFLRARSVGVDPGPLFDVVLDAVVAAATDHLTAYGILQTSTNARHRMAARHLARHYAAEQVLSAADTGSTSDVEGASMTLSGGDIAHWQKMRDTALADAERILGPLPGNRRSGVFFAPVRLLTDSSDDASY